MYKECDRKKSAEWYQKNLEHAREKRKIWQEDNYEKHMEHVGKYLAKKAMERPVEYEEYDTIEPIQKERPDGSHYTYNCLKCVNDIIDHCPECSIGVK